MNLAETIKEILHPKKIYFSRKIFFLIVFLIPLIFWSIKEFYNFRTDFGVYYAGSFYISDDYQLYNDHFTHKGPFYYLFIKFISNLIGWGLNQSILTLFFSILVFYIPIIFSIFKYCRSNLSIIAMLLVSIAILNFQSANSSIAFFQEGLLIISFIPILEKKYELKQFFTVILFFWLAVFTRIDSLVFLPLIFLYFLNVYERKKLFKKVIIKFSLFIVPFLIFIYLSNFYDFTFQEFIINNFDFNSWYKNNYFPSPSNIFFKFIDYLDRPRALILSMQSMILPLLILIIYKKSNFSILPRELYFKLSNYFFEKKLSIVKALEPSLLIILLSLFSFLITNSDRDYHSLIFLCPTSLIVIINFENVIKKFNYLIPILIIYLFIPFLIIFSSSYIKIYTYKDILPPYSETIDFIKTNNIDPEIIGGRGWVYFLSGKKPIRAINDWWLYLLEEPYLSESLLNQHKKLLNRESGYIFWINNYLLKKQTKNNLLNQIKSISEKIEDQGFYTMYKIK